MSTPAQSPRRAPRAPRGRRGRASRSCRCAPSSRGAALELAGAEQADDGAADRARERVAAEGRAVLARAQHAEHVARPPRRPTPARCRRRAPCRGGTRRASTPSWSQANGAPVRPRPDWISSAMNSTLCASQISRTPRAGSRRAARSRRPRPGSARAARPRCRSSIAASSASTSPYGTTSKPGVNGPKPSRASGSAEKPTMVVVRPWKLPAATMILARSVGHALDLVAPLAGDLDARSRRPRRRCSSAAPCPCRTARRAPRRTGRAGRCGTPGWSA